MGKLDGRVAVVSGAARGQGRSHAVTLAREGASIVAFDACAGFEYPMTPPATEDDLQETVRLVEEQDQRCIAVKADARDGKALGELADTAMAELGRVDVLCVNHGIWSIARTTWETPDEQWDEMIDICLTGAFKVCKAFMPKIVEGGRGGSVILTSSSNAIQPGPSSGAYTAAKTGVVGLMKVLATEAGEYNIRVNTVHPGGVSTPMLLEGGTMEKSAEWRPEFLGVNRHLLPLEWQEPIDISNAVLWLASDDSRYVTGAMLPIDGGWTVG